VSRNNPVIMMNRSTPISTADRTRYQLSTRAQSQSHYHETEVCNTVTGPQITLTLYYIYMSFRFSEK